MALYDLQGKSAVLARRSISHQTTYTTKTVLDTFFGLEALTVALGEMK